jgi:hypothetical protein
MKDNLILFGLPPAIERAWLSTDRQGRETNMFRTLTLTELAEVLAAHKLWLEGTKGGVRANLQSADLQGADLQEADLQSANLRWANLRSANLQWADLRGADLQGANLREANLRRANLPNAPMLLMAAWGEVSDALTTDLMRYDASNHPDPTLFDVWAKGGPCPMSMKWARAACFQEKKSLWIPGESPSALSLVLRLFTERGISR